MGQNKNIRFVYSSDGSHRNICPKCGELPCQCEKVVEIHPDQVIAKIRLESKGRGGKSVSVVFNLPHNPDYFTKLAKKLKAQCGTGGTYKNGQIEIQGDHREKMKGFLEKQGFKVKFAGG